MTGSRDPDGGESRSDLSLPSRSSATTGPFIIGLKKRAEFQRVSKGRRHNVRTLGLQALRRPDEDGGAPRFGLTVTKRVGNAVERNRIKRRFRHVLRTSELKPQGGHDYVIVARQGALTAPFEVLVADLKKALGQAAGGRGAGRAAQSVARPNTPGSSA